MKIKRPVITEKSLAQYKNNNKVTFEVSLDTNKIEASKMIEKLYGVKVLNVWTNSRLGKIKYNRLSRKKSKLSDRKFMTFELKKGDKIDLFNE